MEAVLSIVLAEEKFQVLKIEKEKEGFVAETLRLKMQLEAAETSIKNYVAFSFFLFTSSIASWLTLIS